MQLLRTATPWVARPKFHFGWQKARAVASPTKQGTPRGELAPANKHGRALRRAREAGTAVVRAQGLWGSVVTGAVVAGVVVVVGIGAGAGVVGVVPSSFFFGERFLNRGAVRSFRRMLSTTGTRCACSGRSERRWAIE
jgi:hypothetical protein